MYYIPIAYTFGIISNLIRNAIIHCGFIKRMLEILQHKRASHTYTLRLG